MVGEGPLILLQGFPERRSGCEQISPDPLGYGAKLNDKYPTLELGPGPIPQRSYIFPWKGSGGI